MSGIGIITNPYSKLNKRNPSRSALLGYILGQKGVIETTKSMDHLAEVAVRFRDQAITILAINGGDGTISRTLTAFINAYGERPLPKVALLRGGTMNVLAGHLGIRGQPENLLYGLLQMQSREDELPVMPLRALVVEGNHGFVYADGSNTLLLENYYRKKSNVIAAAWLFVKVIVSFLLNKGPLFRSVIQGRTIDFTAVPNATVTHSSLGVYASTISNLPLGVPILKGGPNDPERFQAISVTCPAEKLLWYLPAIMLLNKEGISVGKLKQFCRELVIASTEPGRYTLDGEVITAQGPELRITLGKEIQFIRL